ncbi:hypothetical protein ACLOJK_041397 [Asimina triloba]
MAMFFFPLILVHMVGCLCHGLGCVWISGWVEMGGKVGWDVIDDSLSAEVVEDSGENLYEPPEVQELLDEMGNPGIPLSVISKAAEIQILDVVDKVLLGNRWIRKATGIQPKFPYLRPCHGNTSPPCSTEKPALGLVVGSLTSQSYVNSHSNVHVIIIVIIIIIIVIVATTIGPCPARLRVSLSPTPPSPTQPAIVSPVASSQLRLRLASSRRRRRQQPADRQTAVQLLPLASAVQLLLQLLPPPSTANGEYNAERQMLDEMAHPRSRSWSTKLKGCCISFSACGPQARSPLLARSSQIMHCSLRDGIGKTLHGHVVKGGYDLDVSVRKALINMYAKRGFLYDSHRLFDHHDQYTSCVWSIMCIQRREKDT